MANVGPMYESGRRRRIRPPKDPWKKVPGGRPAQESGWPNTPDTGQTEGYTGPNTTTISTKTYGAGGAPVNPGIDFDALLNSDPRVIASKAALDENVAAAKLAKEAAIKRAQLALGLSQADIARQAGFQQADTGASLAGRGILQSGAYGGALSRIEENRAKALASANLQAQDVVDAATGTEADLIRQYNQAYQQALADASAALSADPRYQTTVPSKSASSTPKASGGGGGGASKPPKAKKPKLSKLTKNRLKAGRM